MANVRLCTTLCGAEDTGSSRRELHAAVGRRRREAAEQRVSERRDWENISRASASQMTRRLTPRARLQALGLWLGFVIVVIFVWLTFAQAYTYNSPTSKIMQYKSLQGHNMP